MGVEWGGKGSESPKKSTPKPDRIDQLTAAMNRMPAATPETAAEPSPQVVETVGELSTRETVELMAKLPKPPAVAGRRLN